MIDGRALELLRSIGRDGARFKDLKRVVHNPRTLATKLERLRSLGLVEKEGSLYKLTQRGKAVTEKLEEVEELLHPRPPVRNVERIPHAHYAPVVRRFCEILLEVLGERLISVVLFGSVARGDWREGSDIDMLVVADGWEEEPVWERMRELRRAERMLEESAEYSRASSAGYAPVIQPYPLSREEARRFNRIYLDVLVDGIILYDKDDFIATVLDSLREKLREMRAVRVVLPDRRYYWVLKDVEAGEVVSLD